MKTSNLIIGKHYRTNDYYEDIVEYVGWTYAIGKDEKHPKIKHLFRYINGTRNNYIAGFIENDNDEINGIEELYNTEEIKIDEE